METRASSRDAMQILTRSLLFTPNPRPRRTLQSSRVAPWPGCAPAVVTRPRWRTDA
jgi:hypothetical protein